MPSAAKPRFAQTPRVHVPTWHHPATRLVTTLSPTEHLRDHPIPKTAKPFPNITGSGLQRVMPGSSVKLTEPSGTLSPAEIPGNGIGEAYQPR